MQHQVDESRLKQEIYQFISQSFIHLDEGERQLMKRFGLTVTQYWALVHLKDVEGRSLSELANLLICDKSNVTSIVDKLEETGLAERKRGKAGDRRYTRVVLTPEGRRLREMLISAHEHLIALRFAALSDHELQQLHASTQQLAHELQSQFEENEVTAMIEDSCEYSQSTRSSDQTSVSDTTTPVPS